MYKVLFKGNNFIALQQDSKTQFSTWQLLLSLFLIIGYRSRLWPFGWNYSSFMELLKVIRLKHITHSAEPAW